MRECVYGPRSLGSGMNQKSRKKPLPMWPDTSRRRGRKSPFWSLLKTSCFEKTAGVCSTLAQFLAEMSFQRVMKPLYKPFNTYRTLSITENIRIGRSGWRKTPRHHRHPAHIATIKKANNNQKQQTNGSSPKEKHKREPSGWHPGGDPNCGFSSSAGWLSSWTTFSQ